jgi:hypothetical protein
MLKMLKKSIKQGTNASSSISTEDTKIVSHKKINKKVRKGSCPCFGLCDPCLICEIFLVSSIVNSLCGDADCNECDDDCNGGCCSHCCCCCSCLRNIFNCCGHNDDCHCERCSNYNDDFY